MTHAPPVDSPCISVCLLDPESGLCQGCYRTMEEIAEWLVYAPQERAAVLAAIEQRRRDARAAAARHESTPEGRTS